jgi:hypothetical protein
LNVINVGIYVQRVERPPRYLEARKTLMPPGYRFDPI